MMDFPGSLMGAKTLRLKSGATRDVNVVQIWQTVEGVPMTLVDKDGTHYRWEEIQHISPR